MRVQKLYYFSTAYSLVVYETNLTQHNFQAWPYGPVLPNLYDALAHYGNKNIEKFTDYKNNYYFYEKGDAFNAITKTINILINKNDFELSNMSHSHNGPWHSVFKKDDGSKKEIQISEIKAHFEQNRFW